MTSYIIELLPSARKIVDEILSDLIKEKKITATHVVNKIIIGASMNYSMNTNQ
jgi:hypothetical protein